MMLMMITFIFVKVCDIVVYTLIFNTHKWGTIQTFLFLLWPVKFSRNLKNEAKNYFKVFKMVIVVRPSSIDNVSIGKLNNFIQIRIKTS